MPPTLVHPLTRWVMVTDRNTFITRVCVSADCIVHPGTWWAYSICTEMSWRGTDGTVNVFPLLFHSSIFCCWAQAATLLRFLDHIQPVGLLWTSDRLVASYATKNKHKRRTSMHWAGFEPEIPALWPPQTNALDNTATGNGPFFYRCSSNNLHSKKS